MRPGPMICEKFRFHVLSTPSFFVELLKQLYVHFSKDASITDALWFPEVSKSYV